MAKYKVSGKSVQQLLRIRKSTLNNLTPKELRQVTSRLVSAMNKRIRRLETYAREHNNITIPSLDALHSRNITKFSIKNVRDERLLDAYEEMKRFYEYKTSTIQKYIATRKKLDKATEDAVGFDYTSLSQEEKDDIWDVYAMIKEENAPLFEEIKQQKGGTNGYVVQAIYNLKGILSPDELKKQVTNLVELLHQKETNDKEVKRILKEEFSIIK